MTTKWSNSSILVRGGVAPMVLKIIGIGEREIQWDGTNPVQTPNSTLLDAKKHSKTLPNRKLKSSIEFGTAIRRDIRKAMLIGELYIESQPHIRP